MGNSSPRHVVTYHPSEGFFSPRVKREEYDVVSTPDYPFSKIPTFKRWYPDGQINVEGNLGGYYREWHRNGNPKMEGTIDARGRFKGTRTEWHPDGKVRVVAEFKRDKAVRILSLCDELGRDCLLPDGEQIVWKACITNPDKKNKVGVYVKIMVPKEAGRVTPIDTDNTYKSRISHGVVLAIESEDGKQYDSAVSFVYTRERLTYVVGERVAFDPDDFDDDLGVECGAGINVHRYRDQCTKWFRSNR